MGGAKGNSRCGSCGRRAGPVGGDLCAECLAAGKSPRPRCAHCRRRWAGRKNRGLCQTCWLVPDVRLAQPGRVPARVSRPDHEPTEAELEALIAEQERNLPAWWWRDSIKLARAERGR
jgi:hypothetical protein